MGKSLNFDTGAGVNVSGAGSTETEKKVTIGLNLTDANLPKATKTEQGLMSAADKEKLDGVTAGAQPNAVTSVASKTGAVTLVKGDVGLGNVDNTADANKSVANAATLKTARAVDGVNFDGSAAITHYGTCATAAATVEKVVALTGFALATGARVVVMFTVTNTAANPTMNVNSSGAKAIYYRNAAITAGALAANRVYEFVYDGTQWELIGDLDTNTTYSAATTSAAGLMSAADKAKVDGISALFDTVKIGGSAI
jgi:hypothetical protein